MGIEAAAILGSAALSVGQTVVQNRANNQTADQVRQAGRIDRTSRGLSRIEQLRALGRETQAEQGQIRTTTANRGVTGNTAALIEQAVLSAALFDQRNIQENYRLGVKSQVTTENSRLGQLRESGLLFPAAEGALSGLLLGKSLAGGSL